MLDITELLTPADVARQLHVTPAAVRLWARLGQINVALHTSTGTRLYTRAAGDRVAIRRAVKVKAKHGQ